MENRVLSLSIRLEGVDLLPYYVIDLHVIELSECRPPFSVGLKPFRAFLMLSLYFHPHSQLIYEGGGVTGLQISSPLA